MRRLIVLLFIILSTPFLQNSRQEENMNEYKFYMTATITNIDEKISVNVISGEFAYGDYLIITGDDTQYSGVSSKEQLQVGDTIKITYGGQVMMSYPPQVVAKNIEVLKNRSML